MAGLAGGGRVVGKYTSIDPSTLTQQHPCSNILLHTEKGPAVPYTHIVWDLEDDPDGNLQHIDEHGVTKEEVDDVLSDPVSVDSSRSSGFPIAFGFSKTGRYLAVIFDEIDTETAYPITAYDVPV